MTAVVIAVLKTARACSGIHDAADIERGGVEKLVRIELFKGSRVDQLRFDVARNGDDRGAFFPRVHQAVKQVSHAGAGRAAHRNGISREVGLCNRGEDAVLFIPHMNEVNISIPAERIDDGIESVPHNSIAAFHASLLKHFPH